MPDYEGLIRAVESGTGLCDVRNASEASIAAHIASMAAPRPPNLADALMDALDRMPDRKPKITGEQVRCIVDSEFDLSCGWPRDCGEYPTDAQRAHAWDRVAAKLSKP